ncbi:MAG: energy-coupling factor ABC transporter ATP-binding protein, partial [Candidatus Eiseniibacteriota bacterium]
MSLIAAHELWAAPPGALEPVVRGVSLEIGRGEWVALSGPNGGGKTTLALALAGLRPLRCGRVSLSPEIAASARDRRQLAVILQDPSAQLFTATVRDELGYAARNLGCEPAEVERRIAEWAGRLGLESDLARDPHTLSAGRQQLVLIASAMVTRPSVLIADEPGAHLDPPTRERVIGAIRAEVSRGLAVLWLTQAEREIEAADRTIWIGEADRSSARPGAAATHPPGGGEPAIASVRIGAWDGRGGPA